VTELEQLGDAYIELQQDLMELIAYTNFYGEQLMTARAIIAKLRQDKRMREVN
jgi:hypothetical protein